MIRRDPHNEPGLLNKTSELEKRVRALEMRDFPLRSEGSSGYDPAWCLLKGGGYQGGSSVGSSPVGGTFTPLIADGAGGFGPSIFAQSGGFTYADPQDEDTWTWFRGIDCPDIPGSAWLFTASWEISFVVGTDVGLNGGGFPYWMAAVVRQNPAWTVGLDAFWEAESYLHAAKSPWNGTSSFPVTWGGHYTSMHYNNPAYSAPNTVGFTISVPTASGSRGFLSRNFTELNMTWDRSYSSSAFAGNPGGFWDILICQVGQAAVT